VGGGGEWGGRNLGRHKILKVGATGATPPTQKKFCAPPILPPPPMPTHDDALLQAYAACPPSARVFHTLEIWQSSFDEPARIVANVGDDMFFGIEPGAPHDGGALVQFTACPLTSDYPEQRAGQAPTSKIKIDNVNRELV